MRICLEITNRCKSSLKSKVNCRSNSCQETQMKWTTLEIKAYVSEEILNWHCLSLSLNADFCIHFYWLSQLRQANHQKMIQSSALCQFKISWNTPALRSLRRTTHFNTLISDFLPLTKETVVYGKRISRPSPLFIHFNCCCSSPAGYEPLFTGHFYKSAHGFISQFISFNLRRWPILLIYIYSFFQKYAR